MSNGDNTEEGHQSLVGNGVEAPEEPLGSKDLVIPQQNGERSSRGDDL